MTKPPIRRRTAGKNRFTERGEDNLLSSVDRSFTDHHVGEGELRFVPMSKIDFDPDQPRNLPFGQVEIEAYRDKKLSLDDLSINAKLAMEAIVGLASTIEEQRLIHPVTIYPYGERYRVVEGERRTLAHFYLNAANIKAVVIPKKPDNIALLELQLVENIQREDLTLAERVDTLARIESLFQSQGKSGLSLQYIEKRLGIKKSQGSLYMTTARGPKDVRDAVVNGTIKSLRLADKIARVTDVDERKILIDQAALANIEDNVTWQGSKKPETKKPGKPAAQKTLPLGRIARPVIKTIIEKTLGNKVTEVFDGVNWDNDKEAVRAWREFLSYVEKEFND